MPKRAFFMPFFAVLAFALPFHVTPSRADATKAPPPSSTACPASQQTATRVETDAKTGAILFIVNGQEQARIDTTGLHVRRDVEYGGVVTNTGLAYDSGGKPGNP